MSKCFIRITFDNPERTYRGGDKVSGEVHIQVNEDIRCNGIILNHYWRTHGRGNSDWGTKHEIRLTEMQPLQAGEELHLPFEFKAELWPLTYHGNYIYLDHYVHVAVDVPWAIDPKLEEEYILLPGKRPSEFTGERGEIITVEQKDAKEMGAVGKVVLYGFVALIIVMLAIPFFFFVVPLTLIGGGGFWVWKKMIASRVGNVEYTIPHVVVGPGEQLPVKLNFTPKKTFPINGITVKVEAIEAATSGSGTNKTTHYNTVFEEIHTLRPEGAVTGGDNVHEEVVITIPESNAWSLDESDNDVKWTIEARIDIPRFPDWAEKKVIQLVPLEFLNDAKTSAAAKKPVAESISIDNDDPLPPPVSTYAADSESAADQGRAAASSSEGEDMSPLLALLDEIHAAGRFSNERTEIAEAADGHTYDVVIELERASTTFGFKGDDERYETGRTLLGKLVGTDHEVQMFTVEDSNPGVDELNRGDRWQTLCTVREWDTLYDRLVLHEVPFD